MSAQTDLDAINAALTAIASGGAVQNYEINGRSVRHYSVTELLELQKYFQNVVSAATPESGGGGRTFASFGRPT